MQILLWIIQVIVSLGILNVWLVRRNRQTSFRGGVASNIREEFAHYGLPAWTVTIVGSCKVILAFIILAGFINPSLTPIGATGLGCFMLGAVIMHLKVRDSFIKLMPSLLMLVMCVVLAFGTIPNLALLASNL